MYAWRMVTCVAVVLALGNVSWGIINPRFTPVHLTEEANLIVVGPVQATEDSLQWKLMVTANIKGKRSADDGLSLTACKKDDLQEIQQTLGKSGQQPVILFADTEDEEKRGYLHVLGAWLNVRADGQDGWQV